MLIENLLVEVLREATKMLSGQLLTEAQIKTATNNIVGRHFADWFPLPQRQVDAETRINDAKHHITAATRIVAGLQDDLEKQATTLEGLAKEIEEKKKAAEKYALLAQTNQEAFAAFRTEMEETVRKELTSQSEKGKNIRRVASFVFWFITLILGAALGAYFQFQMEPYFKKENKQSIPSQTAPNLPVQQKGNGSN